MENDLLNQFGNVPDKVETTGRFLVAFKDDESETQAMSLLKKANLNIASTSDFKDFSFSAERVPENSNGLYYKELKVALVTAQPQTEQMAILKESVDTGTDIIVEPERVVYALNGLDSNYLEGYFDAVKHLYDKAKEGQNLQPAAALTEQEVTWGIQATNVLNSKFTGIGVSLAVLDTGFNWEHPDFIGRMISSQSFVGEEVEDLNGHGSHCIGTALGPKLSQFGARYGVAYDATIFAGKVLSNAGRGTDGGILDGIEWAVENKCKIISMSLGAPAFGQSYSRIFQRVARRVMNKGTLIIAAAGNDSNRNAGIIRPVSHPANCPSIMAVAAVDSKLRVANFSNGGQVDIAAPGVAVYSSWKAPLNFNTISGTSMATPHVAGIAALYAEANPKATPYELWQMLTAKAKRLNLPSSDVGSGLVQAK